MVGLKSTSQKEQTFKKLPIPCLVEAGASVLHSGLKIRKKSEIQGSRTVVRFSHFD